MFMASLIFCFGEGGREEGGGEREWKKKKKKKGEGKILGIQAAFESISVFV